MHSGTFSEAPAWREAFSDCLEKITAFYTARGHNRALFECWKAVSEDDGFAEQPAAFRRMVEQELIDFRQSGVDLPDRERERFAEISLRLSKLGNTFGNHVLDATEGWSEDFDNTQALAGLPVSDLETLAAKAAEAGGSGWRADLSYPCYRAVVTYADDRDLRRQHGLVDQNLIRRKVRRDGETARDVTGITMVLGAHVQQRLVALLE